jgi:hypothetical protein
MVGRPTTDLDGARSREAMAARSDQALERARERRARLAFGVMLFFYLQISDLAVVG